MNTKEIWKDIENYEGYYQVSNLGRVKSLLRYVKNGVGYRKVKCRILKHGLNNPGYEFVYLYRNQKSKVFAIHRLVSIAFIPNPKNKPQVNHLDSNRRNNVVSNLEWCDQVENMKHAFNQGNFDVRGEKNHFSKLTDPKVRSIKELINNGLNDKYIAEQFKVARNTIGRIRNNQTWKHI